MSSCHKHSVCLLLCTKFKILEFSFYLSIYLFIFEGKGFVWISSLSLSRLASLVMRRAREGVEARPGLSVHFHG